MQVDHKTFSFTSATSTSSWLVVGDTLAIQCVGAGTTCTETVEVSLDGTTWYALSLTPSAGGSAVTTFTAVGLWTANIAAYTYVRVRCSTYGSGTVTGIVSQGRTGD